MSKRRKFYRNFVDKIKNGGKLKNATILKLHQLTVSEHDSEGEEEDDDHEVGDDDDEEGDDDEDEDEDDEVGGNVRRMLAYLLRVDIQNQ